MGSQSYKRMDIWIQTTYDIQHRSSFNSSTSISRCYTTANISDKPAYPDTVSGLLPETLKNIHYMVADPGFSGKKLYDFSLRKQFQLVCPVKRYKNTPIERLKLAEFYESALGQVIYSKRKISIEPLIEHISNRCLESTQYLRKD